MPQPEAQHERVLPNFIRTTAAPIPFSELEAKLKLLRIQRDGLEYAATGRTAGGDHLQTEQTAAEECERLRWASAELEDVIELIRSYYPDTHAWRDADQVDISGSSLHRRRPATYQTSLILMLGELCNAVRNLRIQTTEEVYNRLEEIIESLVQVTMDFALSHARYGYLPAEYIGGMSEANLLQHGRDLWIGQIRALKVKAQECGARRAETLRFDFLVEAMSSDKWLRLGMEKTIGDRRATFQRILIAGAHRTEIISKILPEEDRLEYILKRIRLLQRTLQEGLQAYAAAHQSRRAAAPGRELTLGHRTGISHLSERYQMIYGRCTTPSRPANGGL